MKDSGTISQLFTCYWHYKEAQRSWQEHTKCWMGKPNFLSLLRSWESKVIALLKAEDFTKLEVDKLIGSLITYKMINSNEYEKRKKKKKK